MARIALDGPRRGPASGRAAKQLVILVHGLGSDGADIGVLAEPFSRALPNAAFAAPNAPFFADPDRTTRQWFPIGDMPVARLHAGMEVAAAALHGFVEAERARLGLSAPAVALAGFSQGAILALWAAFRHAPGPGAVLAYAGALIGDSRFAAELRWKPPVLLVYGTEDEVIAPAYAHSAERVLQALGVPIRALFRRGLGHGLDEACIAAGAAFLADWADGTLVAAAPREGPSPWAAT
jgi:phospholipase/carboxylesterase